MKTTKKISVKADKELFLKLKDLKTEQRNPRTREIDLADSRTIASLINEEDKTVAAAVGNRLDVIADAVDSIVENFKKGGRLLYFGAGTSGRLGVVDASECPPTYGTDPELVQGFIAGGREAMFRSQEKAEDSEDDGAAELEKLNVTEVDTVTGIAASGRTPYVHGVIKEAKRRGCKTILITTVSADQVDLTADFMIDLPVGPEVVTGSTRMKSGTAQKMVLNMLTTASMIRMGKVFENVMVDLQLTNKKLEERAKQVIMTLSGCSYDEAMHYLESSDRHVKTALVMALTGVSAEQAREKLRLSDGFIRLALNI